MLDFKEVTRTYTHEEAIKEASRCLNCKVPFCKKNGCPAGLRINEFIACLKNDDVNGAYEILMDGTNLSPICSRVCDHRKQCIGNCIRNKMKTQDPVHVGPLERYVMENKTVELKPVTTWSDKKVAIIGSGPAGISCALELVKNGIHATVYEREKHLGGVMSYGIPEYRLPKKLLNEHIEFTKRMGVNYVTEHEAIPSELLNNYDMVFIGCGLGKYKSLRIPGEDAKGVYSAGDFLKTVNMKESYGEGEGVKLQGITYVVGAGNVAMDCCRTSQRVGSDKTVVVYRRSLEEAPASKDELDDAMAEGVSFNFLHNPVEIITENGKVKAIKCEIMELGEPDESGRRSPVGSGKYEEFKCDNVIVAIGQSPDKNLTEKFGIELNSGYIVSNDGITTSDERILAGGDIVRGADTVVRSMVDGKKAAHIIIDRLK